MNRYDYKQPELNNIPTVSCLAALDSVIRERLKAGDLQVGPVAKFDGTDDAIVVDGMFRGRGRYGFTGIRWHREGVKGLFGKGIACYGPSLPAHCSLPIVK